MKTLVMSFMLLVSLSAQANDVIISPGSSVRVGDTTVMCTDNGEHPNDRCGEVSSTDSRVNTCSGRLRGVSCIVDGFRGVCDFRNEGGMWNTCKCQ